MGFYCKKACARGGRATQSLRRAEKARQAAEQADPQYAAKKAACEAARAAWLALSDEERAAILEREAREFAARQL